MVILCSQKLHYDAREMKQKDNNFAWCYSNFEIITIDVRLGHDFVQHCHLRYNICKYKFVKFEEENMTE